MSPHFLTDLKLHVMRNKLLLLSLLSSTVFLFSSFKKEPVQSDATGNTAPAEKNRQASMKKGDFILGYLDHPDGYTVYFHGDPVTGSITYIEVFITDDMTPLGSSYSFAGTRNTPPAVGYHVTGYFVVDATKGWRHYVDNDINGL